MTRAAGLDTTDVSPQHPAPAPGRDFDAVMTHLMPDLLAYFVRRVTPREDGADCLSETLVVLWRRRLALPAEPGEQRAWAFGVAKKILANHHRGSLRRHALGERMRAQIRDTTAEIPAPDASELLSVLSPTDRELVRLIIWDGFTIAEAGALLHLRAGAARMRYSRAKDKLRALQP